MEKPEKIKQGKKNRRDGAAFELKVRKDLEDKKWIVAKWTNNVEFMEGTIVKFTGETKVIRGNDTITTKEYKDGKLIPAKAKWNNFTKSMMMGKGGFPDFITFKKPWIEEGNLRTMWDNSPVIGGNQNHRVYSIFGIEVKMNGQLDKIEKEKCNWLLDNGIFSKIIIAKRGEKRGKIIYSEYTKDL